MGVQIGKLQPYHEHTTLLYAQGDASGRMESALDQGSAYTSEQIPSLPRWDYVRFYFYVARRQIVIDDLDFALL